MTEELEVETGDGIDISNIDDDSVPPTTIEDEDTSDDVVRETDVLAEVKLPSRFRKCSFLCASHSA